MKIIDAHMHFSRISSFEECARHTSLTDYSENGYKKEAEANGVVRSVCMGLSECSPGGFPDIGAKTPMKADLSERLPRGVSLCLGVNPHTLDMRSLAEIESLVISHAGSIAGIKIYAGYYHFDVCDPVYDPVYKLAEKHDLAVVIHTGDTYSGRGLLKYSHPLCIDELAVRRPGLRIVACHMGVPWVFDACEVAAKNQNVYLDLSGMLEGNAEYIERVSENHLIMDRYRLALSYLENYDKILYGSDWPLVPMGAYIEFCKKLIPADAHDRVFFQNAVRVFKLIID